MKKAEIRKLALEQRKSLSTQQVEDYSRKLLHHFSGLNFLEIAVIHIFLPITEKKEPDTFLFIDWLRTHHPEIKIIVPRADFDTALMTNHEYLGRTGLKKNLYNILEPQQADLHTGDVDLVIVPLLAFDKRGYRVGYGKGFYDRFLQNIRTQKIGVSFFDASDHIDDVHENDIKLDVCITPTKVYTFPVNES